MGDDAAAGAAHVCDGLAPVQQLLVPQEGVAGLAAKRGLLQTVVVALLSEVRGGVGQLGNVPSAAITVAVEVRRHSMTGGEVTQRTGIGVYVLQADRRDDQLAARRRRHVVRVDVVLLAAAALEMQRVDRHDIVADELAHGRDEGLGEHHRADQIIDQVHVVELVDVLTGLVGSIGEKHSARLAAFPGDERIDHQAAPVLAARGPRVVEAVRGPARLGRIEQAGKHEVTVALPQLASCRGRRRRAGRASAMTLDLLAQRRLDRFRQTAGQRLQHHVLHPIPRKTTEPVALRGNRLRCGIQRHEAAEIT